jgi:hypothetical protein
LNSTKRNRSQAIQGCLGISQGAPNYVLLFMASLQTAMGLAVRKNSVLSDNGRKR